MRVEGRTDSPFRRSVISKVKVRGAELGVRVSSAIQSIRDGGPSEWRIGGPQNPMLIHIVQKVPLYYKWRAVAAQYTTDFLYIFLVPECMTLNDLGLTVPRFNVFCGILS